MTDYGIQPTGYVRKPLSVILSELEAAMITEFGAGVIQTPQSPLGQLNALMSDLIAEIDERGLDLYQSYDPDQAEGNRLDILAKLRLFSRGDKSDTELRQAITNVNQSRIDIQDINDALAGIDDVEFVRIFVNETGEITNSELERGTIAVAIIGGDETTIAQIMRQYIVPGVNTYGNTYVSSEIDGFCRSFAIIRPIEVPITLTVNLKISADRFGCPAPSLAVIKARLVDDWASTRYNGLNITPFTIRSIIESAFSSIEVTSILGSRDGIILPINTDVSIGFIEIAQLIDQNITLVTE